jgi:hypothetical protein
MLRLTKNWEIKNSFFFAASMVALVGVGAILTVKDH